jgi:hypothetical protein
MATKFPYPDFASEAEEADWLYEHREELDLYFSPMDGNVGEMLLRDHNLILPQAYMSVPLSNEDIAFAKALADADGLSSAEYLGQVMHEALQAKRAA